MPKIRLYQDDTFSKGSVILNSRNQHYITNVLRSPEADIILFNGDGWEYFARVSEYQHKVRATIISKTYNTCEPLIRSTLIQAIAKSDKMDYIVQKATELGVKTIIPVLTKRVIVKLTASKATKKREHWQEIAINAAEQSGRAVVPYIGEIQTLDQLRVDTKSSNYVLDPVANKSLLDYVRNLSSQQPVSMCAVIGPEGGLSKDEISTLIAKGYKSLSLGRRILRTETASLAFLSNVELLFGTKLHLGL